MLSLLIEIVRRSASEGLHERTAGLGVDGVVGNGALEAPRQDDP